MKHATLFVCFLLATTCRHKSESLIHHNDQDFKDVRSIILTSGNQQYDLSDDQNVKKSLLKVKKGHWIEGRSVHAYEGVIQIDGKRFRVRPATLQSGTTLNRVILISDSGIWYEGDDLADLLLPYFKHDG